MPHAFATVVVPFDDQHSTAVNARLNQVASRATPSLSQALNDSAFVHFMSIVVVPGSANQSAHLVLEITADGYPGGVLDRLASVIGPQICEVFETAGVRVSMSELGEFLARHDRQVGQGWFSVPGVVFDGTPGMTVRRIRREQRLAARIQAILDELPAQASALAVLHRVREQVFSEGIYKWAFVAEPVPLLAGPPKTMRVVLPALWSGVRTFLWPLAVLPLLAGLWKGVPTGVSVGFLAGLLAGVWAAVLTLGVELVLVGMAAGLAYLSLRRKEKADVPDNGDLSPEIAAEFMAREDQCMQNHLTAVSTMKPGWLRRFTLRLALWAVGAFAPYRTEPGTLRNIRTIHFARWILLPGTDKLLFFSNYSGSWESYLEDFIVRAHDGLTGVWSNTEGFPRASNLVHGGAQDGDRFKRWARRQQQPTRFWYTAYPDLMSPRIRINARIRDGFATASTEHAAARWLEDFGYAPPLEGAALESDRIPILVFGGIPALRCARSLVLRLPDGAVEAARGWLAAIEPHIGYGERTPERSTLVLGLSESGLLKLGLDVRDLATFPTAFQQGMATPWRSRALGDIDENAPDRWQWGGPGTRADAILNVYATSDEVLAEEIDRQRQPLGRFAIKVIYEILLDRIPPKGTPIREPFGFTDGISQPIVRGARKWVIQRNTIHVVEPGEMILGYKDNFDHTPFSPSTADRRHDLGRNGTYLVVRLLEQNATEYRRYLQQTARQLVGDPRVPRGGAALVAEWIAAKMVGRWSDGTSLVRHPHCPGSVAQPGTLPDNDFLFGTEDPHGLRCPFGSHIRRVNPRESFEPGSQPQLSITNRHRIFRVGRSYGPQNGLEHPGLLFMCVNANIERQFEFMQQTYMLGASFHGLENEVDSFARRRSSSGVLTIPTDAGPLRLKSMSSFVRVRGGGYFFMPGRDTVRFLIDGGKSRQ